MVDIKPINIEDLLERVDGNIEFALQMLDKFFNSYEERIAEIKKHIEAKDFTEIKNSSHKLKGITGNLSLVKCFETLLSLEHKAVENNLKACSDILKIAENDINQAREYYLVNQDLFY